MKIATLDLTNSRYHNQTFEGSIKLPKNTIHVFDSFHNSFFESYWWEHTSVRQAAFRLNVKGSGTIELIRNSAGQEQIIQTFAFNDEDQKLSIGFQLSSAQNSRVYLKISPDTDTEIENSVFLETPQEPVRKVRIAVIMCTFNKQSYVTKNMEHLLSSRSFLELDSKILIVDNASNLTLPSHERVEYFPQDNYGGAGGFTRGLIEARNRGVFTHYLFMDDDIEIDPDMILRTCSLASFTSNDNPICGGMLSYSERNILWEMGANFFNKKLSGSSEPCFHYRNLDSKLLNEISSPYSFEYGGWWFFCFSEGIVQKVGLPIPFFIRGDDTEYGIRLGKSGVKNITLPGIAVWHETFFGKTAPWLHYFRFRNYFIIGLLYGNLLDAYKQTLKFLITIVGNLLTYDYNTTSVQLAALKDVLDGRKDIGSLSTPSYKKEITNRLSSYAGNERNCEQHSGDELIRGSALSFFMKAITINGHVLPATQNVIKVEFPNWKRNVLSSQFSHANILVYNDETKTIQEYQKSLSKFLVLTWKLAVISLQLLICLPFLVSLYKKQKKHYSQTDAWKKFLKVS